MSLMGKLDLLFGINPVLTGVLLRIPSNSNAKRPSADEEATWNIRLNKSARLGGLSIIGIIRVWCYANQTTDKIKNQV